MDILDSAHCQYYKSKKVYKHEQKQVECRSQTNIVYMEQIIFLCCKLYLKSIFEKRINILDTVFETFLLQNSWGIDHYLGMV